MHVPWLIGVRMYRHPNKSAIRKISCHIPQENRLPQWRFLYPISCHLAVIRNSNTEGVNSSPLVRHISVGELDRHWFRQLLVAIIRITPNILSTRPQGTYFNEILFEIQIISFKKMLLNMPSANWWPFCHGLNVLTRLQLHDNYFSVVDPHCTVYKSFEIDAWVGSMIWLEFICQISIAKGSNLCRWLGPLCHQNETKTRL